MLIVNTTQPATRPPVGTGPALVAGDIWQATATGARQRFNGSAWAAFTPAQIYSLIAPTQRPGPPTAPLDAGDIWIHTTGNAQAVWDGSAWVAPELPAGIAPSGTAASGLNGAAETHLAKNTTRAFDMKWVEPADGIAFLYEQRVPSDTWVINHDLRSRWVAVTCVDNSRVPEVTMWPDIEYFQNSCRLTFAVAVRGFAVIHASRTNPHIIVQ